MTPRSRGGMIAGGAVAAALAVLVPAGPAQAHDSLQASDPAPGGTASSAPTEVTLTFSDTVLNLGAGSIIRVRDASGLYYGDGCVALSNETMTATAALGDPGTYSVEWRATSVDGHPISDTYDFEYRPASDAPVADGAEAAPTCAEPVGASGADDSEGAAAANALPAVPLVIGAVLVVLGSIGVVLGGQMRARGRRAAAREADGAE